MSAEVSERWTITYVDADGQGRTQCLGTPGPGRTQQEQCTEICDQLRAEGATRMVVEVKCSHRRYDVVSVDARGRHVSRQFDTAEAAAAFADEERANPWISNVGVKQSPVVKRERRAVLDSTGRPI